MAGYLHFRSLHPKKWHLGSTATEMQRELGLLAADAQAVLIATTVTWTHKPTFVIMKAVLPSARLDISARGDNADIFAYVDQGTHAHPIEPKSPVSPSNPSRPSALSTRAEYRAKSSPGVLHSGAGGHSGPVIYKPGVWHPGIPPRHFIAALQIRVQTEIERRMPQAVQRGLDKGIVQ